MSLKSMGSTAAKPLTAPGVMSAATSTDVPDWDLYSGSTVLRSTSDEVLSESFARWYSQGGTVVNSALSAPLKSADTSAHPSNTILRLLSRLRQLRNLSAGRSGAAAPAVQASVDSAIQFIARAGMPLPPIATLDDEGLAVIEMESADMDFFADISFSEDGTVEVYRRETGKPSVVCSGHLNQEEVEHFLRDQIGVLI